MAAARWRLLREVQSAPRREIRRRSPPTKQAPSSSTIEAWGSSGMQRNLRIMRRAGHGQKVPTQLPGNECVLVCVLVCGRYIMRK